MFAERVEIRLRSERVVGTRRWRVHVPECSGRAFVNAQTLLNEFDLIAEAPGGVAKLRELIMQLAVQGKLVPQDPKDEPVTVLLDRIRSEKRRLGLRQCEVLTATTSIKPDVNDDPSGWMWTSLEQIGVVNPRNDAEDSIDVGFAPMAAISERYGKYPSCETRTWGDVKKGFTHFAEGDVGMAKITPCFENGKSAVFRNMPNGLGAGTTELHVFRPILGTIVPEYVWIFIKTPQFRAGGEAVMTGSAGQKRVPSAYFAKTPFPLPPLAEQKRIAARVDELMKRCDALEARQQERNERRIALTAASLHAVTTTERKSAASEIRRVLDSFPLLIDTPESVAELRKTILQLAVQGRLVPQDSSDKPAEAVLEAIRVEKARLVAESQIKRDKPLPPIRSGEMPFSLPDNWQWTRIGDICTVITDGEHITPLRVPSGVPLVTAKNVRDGIMDLSVTDFVEDETANKCWRRCRPEHDDVLMVCVGATTGRICLLKHPDAFVIVRSVALLRPTVPYIVPEYLDLVLRSPVGQSQIWGRVKQSAQPCLYINRMKLLTIPLAPLAEQKRVVAKVKKLIVLCEALEAKLTQSRGNADILAAAIVHEMCNGAYWQEADV